MVFVLLASLAAPRMSQLITVDQFGWTTASRKVAVLADPIEGQNASLSYLPASKFQVCRESDGTAVFTGQTSSWLNGFVSPLAGDRVWFADFSDLKNFAEQFTPSGAISLQPGTKTIDGKTAVGIIDAGESDSDQSILYVEKDGDHLPLEIVPGPKASAAPSSEGPSTGTIDFVDYNKPVTITEPTGAIDISQLMALMGGPSAALVLSDLGELGVERAVRVGTCAAIDPEFRPGELVWVRAARRLSLSGP